MKRADGPLWCAATSTPNSEAKSWPSTSFRTSTTIPASPVIEIGAREFMCVGAKPPFDHPHVFLDMGDDNEIICPYCSTLYRHDPALDPHAARPEACALTEAV